MALRWYCIKNRHDSAVDITTWAQKHFQSPLSVNTICHCIYKCKLRLYHAKKKLYINQIQKHCHLLWAQAHSRWTEAKRKTGLWSDLSKSKNSFWKSWTLHPPGLRGVGPPGFFKSQHVMVRRCISVHGLGNLHICEGTVNAERYIQVSE